MDAPAFERFYRLSAPALRAYLRFSCRDAAIADDLLQEAFLRLLKADLPELEDFQLKSYLYKAARSAMTDHYRRASRERGRVAAAELDVADMPGAKTEASFELPHDIRQVLGELKPRDRQLLWLAYVEGFSHREIAPLLGVQEESVRVLLLRARERLALLLKERGLAPADSA